MLKILIVEDHPIFAEGLQLIIRQGLPEACTVHAGTLAHAKDALHQEQEFALVLLDLWLPDTHGFEGLIALRQEFPKLPIVIVSAFADQGVVHNAMACGAAGFIPKSASRDNIVQGLRTVLAGDVTLPIDYLPAHMVANEDVAALTGRLSSLTRQQLRVLQMLCQGLLNKQIAYHLDVGETTVKAHVGEILRKLSVGSRTQAVLEMSRLDFGAVLALYAGDGPNGSTPGTRRRNGAPAQ
jgi:DNA-binding NarL/FixJ family response regulator